MKVGDFITARLAYLRHAQVSHNRKNMAAWSMRVTLRPNVICQMSLFTLMFIKVPRQI